MRELVDLWWREAKANNVLPLDDRRQAYVLHPGTARIDRLSAPDVTDRSFEIEARMGPDDATADGIVLAHGSRTAEYVLYLRDGRPTFEYVLTEKTVTCSPPPPPINRNSIGRLPVHSHRIPAGHR